MRSRNAAQVIIVGMAMSGLAACVPARVTPFDPALAVDQRTPPDRIRFYDLRPPACRFTEIGRVTARTGLFTTWGSVVRKARKEASRMGGDAIVSVREETRVSGAVITKQSVAATENTTLSGTVVRFADPGCVE